MQHHDVTLPSFLSPFIVNSFGYNSISYKSLSGRDYIKNNTELPYHHFTIKSARLTDSEMNELYCFFGARKAQLISFNFFDAADNFLEKSKINRDYDTGAYEIGIFKIYGNQGYEFTKPILSPLYDSIKIFRNQQEVLARFSAATRKLELEDKIEENDVIEAECSFLKVARFVTQKIEYFRAKDGSYMLNDIIMEELYDVRR
ncbi:MAG: DUF2460 domain-containing protein [Rickettsiaceae bacterium]|nr:DUF2460 domain-containing protein [Rickettsiaceae bacterium]